MWRGPTACGEEEGASRGPATWQAVPEGSTGTEASSLAPRHGDLGQESRQETGWVWAFWLPRSTLGPCLWF